MGLRGRLGKNCVELHCGTVLEDEFWTTFLKWINKRNILIYNKRENASPEKFHNGIRDNTDLVSTSKLPIYIENQLISAGLPSRRPLVQTSSRPTFRVSFNNWGESAAFLKDTLRSSFGHFTANDKLRFAVYGFTLPVCPYLGLNIRWW